METAAVVRPLPANTKKGAYGLTISAPAFPTEVVLLIPKLDDAAATYVQSRLPAVLMAPTVPGVPDGRQISARP